MSIVFWIYLKLFSTAILQSVIADVFQLLYIIYLRHRTRSVTVKLCIVGAIPKTIIIKIKF